MDNSSNLSDILGIQSKTSVSDLLYEKITKSILSGKIKEGYIFPNETVLCEQLKVGRTSLREAYKALELSGYITRTKRGTYVNSRQTILEATPLKSIYENASPLEFTEYRIMLEKEAAFYTAKNISVDELDVLQQNIDASILAKEEMDIDGLILADKEFHKHVTKACGNSLFISNLFVMMETWEKSIAQNFYSVAQKNPEVLEQMIAQHEAIVFAIRSKDAELASKAMESHLKSVSLHAL